MPAPLHLNTVAHFDFSGAESVIVRESFARMESGTKAVYAGVQWGAWAADELVWSERRGAWSSFIPEPKDPALLEELNLLPPDLRTVAAGLDIAGATLEDYELPSAFARENNDGEQPTEPLLRVASGATLVAKSSLNYAPSMSDYLAATATEWRLYNATTGALTASADKSGVLGTVANGSYMLWGSAGNEWSAIRVRVGTGAWNWNSLYYPGPGAPLYRKTGNLTIEINDEAEASLNFDPMARTISASCVLHKSIRTNDGTFDAPVGSLVIGGVRAGRGGPQTALWLIREDLSARLLSTSMTFSDGRCECAKTNHFASDVQQHGDGRLFVLSECDLVQYNPDGPSVFERFSPFPASTDGHPGGQCLRFPSGEIAFWTENFEAVTDGTSWYNRLVIRRFGRDSSGPSSYWHGPNCAETYLGRFWSIRCDNEKTDELGQPTTGRTLYLDYLENGRWHRFNGLSRDGALTHWQRLKRSAMNLFVFGYKPSSIEGEETPTCSVADGQFLYETDFDYFIRRATTSALAGEVESLFVTARSAEEGIGPATRVIEIPSASNRVCSFWSEDDDAFEMSRAAFVAAGGDALKLPLFLVWLPRPGNNGGGVWRPASVAPDDETPFLALAVGAEIISYQLEEI